MTITPSSESHSMFRATRPIRTTIRVLIVLPLVLAFGLVLEAHAQEDTRLQHFRPHDKAGMNVFEPPKEPGAPYEGFVIDWGAAFAQQFQALDHGNAASPNVVDGTDLNSLVEIGPGFNLATANLYLGAQLAEGIRVHLTTYLSSRRHSEAWVKEGYVLVDRVPMIESERLDRIMDYVTVRAGHFEINYGDVHFRRTDNGSAIYNPFVGNYILEAFTTEIGGELYVRTPGGLLGMLAVTGGEIKGAVERHDDRAPAVYAKLGFDREVTEGVRARLTGSVYTTTRSLNNTLYSGDRAGSRYYLVLENPTGSVSENATSGRLNPGFGDEVTAFMVNPFLKVRGLEIFGVIERAEGRSDGESNERVWTQYSGEAVYRFFRDEDLYLGGRYTTASGELRGFANDVSVDRLQAAAGWFLTDNVLVKAEYVSQSYEDFPATDIRSGGEFDGFVVEGVVAF